MDCPDPIEPFFPTEKVLLCEFGMAIGILGNGSKLPTEWNRNIIRDKLQLNFFSSSKEVINAIYSVK